MSQRGLISKFRNNLQRLPFQCQRDWRAISSFQPQPTLTDTHIGSHTYYTYTKSLKASHRPGKCLTALLWAKWLHLLLNPVDISLYLSPFPTTTSVPRVTVASLLHKGVDSRVYARTRIDALITRAANLKRAWMLARIPARAPSAFHVPSSARGLRAHAHISNHKEPDSDLG